MRKQRFRAWVERTVLPGLFLVTSACFGSSSSSEDGVATFQGTWQGFAIQDGQQFRVEFDMSQSGDTITGIVELRDSGIVDLPIQATVIDENTVTGNLSYLGSFRATRQGGSLAVEVTVSNQTAPLTVTLRLDSEEFREFEFPRLDSLGNPVRNYTYQTPAALGDGWDVSTLAAEGVSTAQIEQLVESILDDQYPQMDTLLIARNGKLILEEYFYGGDRERVHGLQSVTKSLSALLIGQAIDQGAFAGTHVPVSSLFTNYPATRWVNTPYSTTVGEMLAMAGALDWNETLPYSDPDNTATQMTFSQDPVEFVLDRPLDGTPGAGFEYCSGLSILMADILFRTTGLHADGFAEVNLFQPLGISEYRWSDNAVGLPDTGGGLSLRARDLLKIGQMMIDGGDWKGTQVVPAGWVVVSSTPQSTNGTTDYGFQWWLPMESFPLVQARGYGGQRMTMVPTEGLVVVQLSGDYEAVGPTPEEMLVNQVFPALD